MEERKEPLYVTPLELYKHTDKIKQELQGDIKTVAANVNNLEKTILPITGFLQAIEQNTRETSVAIKELTKEQKIHTERLHSHDIAINELQRDDDVKLEKEKGKWQFLTILGTGLLGSGGLVAVFHEQITQLATLIFGG